MNAGAASSMQLPRPGDTIAGKYVLESLLGQGGMGAVFAARHVKLSKRVAIKIMLADASSPEAAHRFVNEGRAAANINDDHVVKVDDVDEELGYAYMVLELLEGEDLSQLLAKQPGNRLPPHVAVSYAIQGLSGVAQAHAIGIVHRDLKPSNLFLARRKDGSVIVKVLDFGISKAQGSSALAASPNVLTSTKAMLGSPLYMSPEQLRSSKSVDSRADIWAMGVILYELLTGALPFMGDNLGELFAAILENDPVPLRQRNPQIHPHLDEIVLRCLQRRPEARYASAAELAHALQPFAGFEGGLPTNAPSFHGPPAPSGTMGMGPPMGAVTPSHAQMHMGMPPVAGTVPLGAVTPQQGLMQTSSAWQSTGGARYGVPPKSKVPLLLLAIGAVVFVAGLAIAAILHFTTPKAASVGPASSSVTATTPPPPATAAPTVPPPAASPDPTPPPADAASAPPVKPATPATAHTTRPKVDPPTPHPPDPPAPRPKPTSAPSNNTSGGLQNNR